MSNTCRLGGVGSTERRSGSIQTPSWLSFGESSMGATQRGASSGLVAAQLRMSLLTLPLSLLSRVCTANPPLQAGLGELCEDVTANPYRGSNLRLGATERVPFAFPKAQNMSSVLATSQQDMSTVSSCLDAHAFKLHLASVTLLLFKWGRELKRRVQLRTRRCC